jgi:DNA-binding NarL/FixJ family response regulator
VVDDHPIVRSGVAAVIAQNPLYNVCAECGTAEEAIKAVLMHQPDLAVIDLSLGSDSSIPLFKRLLQHRTSLRMLVLSMHDESVFAPRALQAGAHGYLMKGASIETLNNALQTVLSGQLYVSDGMRNQMLQDMVQGRSSAAASDGVSGLTRTELVVLQMTGAGAGTREIADKLNRSLKTVETHRSNIRRKLNLPNSAALVHFAIQWVRQYS